MGEEQFCAEFWSDNVHWMSLQARQSGDRMQHQKQDEHRAIVVIHEGYNICLDVVGNAPGEPGNSPDYRDLGLDHPGKGMTPGAQP